MVVHGHVEIEMKMVKMMVARGHVEMVLEMLTNYDGIWRCRDSNKNNKKSWWHVDM